MEAETLTEQRENIVETETLTEQVEHFQIQNEENVAERIDKFLSSRFPKISRSHIQKLLKDGLVTVNQKPVKPNYKLCLHDCIKLSLPEPVPPDILPENIPLDILYEDEELLVVNKPKGMVVHPAPGHYTHTLVNAVLYHCGENLSGINGVMRPGIVHRIDRDTTGSLVVCKNDLAHQSLAEQLKAHSITRKYHAIVHGRLAAEKGTICVPIGRHPVERKKMSTKAVHAKRAVTHYTVLERLENSKGNEYTYVECELETGRTHQIRVHMASIGHPLLGDTVYGPSRTPFPLDGQTLHAKVLGFIHPRTGKYMEFVAPIPAYFQKLLEKFRG